MDAGWIPLGYMLKRFEPAPAWLGAPQVREVCALSGCISKSFADNDWRRNGHGLFDRPEDLLSLASAEGVHAGEHRLCYFVAWPEEYVEAEAAWRSIAAPEPAPQVEPPGDLRLLGFDIVTWSTGCGPECSPLSCHHLARELPTNACCLFDRAEDAVAALSAGRFANTEPGPFRVVAMSAVARPE